MLPQKKPNKGRKSTPKEEKHTPEKFYLSSKTYFLTYKGISDHHQKITKFDLANYLTKHNPNDRRINPEKYLVCEETYESGEPHFHVILVYSARKQIKSPDHYDYLGVHPNIQVMRNMKAALDYVYKQDLQPLTNMDLVQEKRVARAKDSSSLYELLEEQMLKDPFNFDVMKYCVTHDLFKQIYKANYTKAIGLIRIAQEAQCNKLLSEKSGFKYIDQALIESQLTPLELETYYSWKGYQKIVDYLNQIIVYGSTRPLKTMNLLISGAPGTGKTSLFHNPNHPPHMACVEDFSSVYHMGMSTWFPKYRSNVYQLILWNEAKLTSYSYDTILKFLEGSFLDLQVKGGIAPKRDNPLIIMTSNLSLQQLIVQKFHKNPHFQELAKVNLAVRIENIIIPSDKNLFLLQKLLVSV